MRTSLIIVGDAGSSPAAGARKRSIRLHDAIRRSFSEKVRELYERARRRRGAAAPKTGPVGSHLPAEIARAGRPGGTRASPLVWDKSKTYYMLFMIERLHFKCLDRSRRGQCHDKLRIRQLNVLSTCLGEIDGRFSNEVSRRGFQPHSSSLQYSGTEPSSHLSLFTARTNDFVYTESTLKYFFPESLRNHKPSISKIQRGLKTGTVSRNSLNENLKTHALFLKHGAFRWKQRVYAEIGINKRSSSGSGNRLAVPAGRDRTARALCICYTFNSGQKRKLSVKLRNAIEGLRSGRRGTARSENPNQK
ncbi:hypothetical protein EVAR_13254_1 [Eumeta japonica]|uniref:Uncharacterized protein n=1 Tax=Eumeta variegata TaxID=151549 RepID=A0A4C1YLD0_EUMVA|nr:hypothetical protein EVAR_13254_1 [Eumeta japonica]